MEKAFAFSTAPLGVLVRRSTALCPLSRQINGTAGGKATPESNGTPLRLSQKTTRGWLANLLTLAHNLYVRGCVFLCCVALFLNTARGVFVTEIEVAQ